MSFSISFQASFLVSYGMDGNTPVPPELQKKLDEYRASVTCDLVKLKNEIRAMKKDGTFLINLLNKIESIAIKSMNENAQNVEQYRLLVSV